MKPKKPKPLRKQCRPTDKIIVTGPATLRISRRAIVVVSLKDFVRDSWMTPLRGRREKSDG